MKKKITDLLNQIYDREISIEPSRGVFGDFNITPGEVRKITQDLGKTPEEFSGEIQDFLSKSDFVDKVVFEGGYVNIYLSKSAYLDELRRIGSSVDAYLRLPEYENESIVFDYSSPNIAKPFSVGHLRSTVIGQANYNIHKALGYNTIGINHLGDWGTQFGKLIVAIKTWGDIKKIEENPIEELNALYVRFHDEAEKDESLSAQARLWFKKLEDGDGEARELWNKCVLWSMAEFDRVYEKLGVKIDEAVGESFYEDKLQTVINELTEKDLLTESDGAQIVELDGMPPALIKKNDGATLYMTRDLAALKYRLEKYQPEKIIYHVGNDQSLHFKQLEAVAKKLGWVRDDQIVFAGHGMIRLPQGKMSTRAGRTILLKDLIEEANQRAMSIIEEKDSPALDRAALAGSVAISAIKYADLSQNRKSDIIFTFEKMISLKGNSAPYLQYSLARASSLLAKAEESFPGIEPQPYLDGESIKVARMILKMKGILENAADGSYPNYLADFLFSLTEEFNAFYEKTRVISEDRDETSKNLYIIKLTKDVFVKLFDLLGLVVVDRI